VSDNMRNELSYGVVPVDWMVNGVLVHNPVAAATGPGIGVRTQARERDLADQREQWRTYMVGGKKIVQRRGNPVSEAEARRLIDEAIAAGKVTECPPGYAVW